MSVFSHPPAAEPEAFVKSTHTPQARQIGLVARHSRWLVYRHRKHPDDFLHAPSDRP